MSKKGLGKLVLGAGLGASIALLFAPKKGSELRGDIKKKFDEFMKNVKYIYAIGEVTDIVYDYACSMNIPCFKGKTLENAMEFLKKNISDGEVVLLSPASSSQDQYPHFEDRGNEFKNIVEKF